jgi:hypothetical protein
MRSLYPLKWFPRGHSRRGNSVFIEYLGEIETIFGVEQVGLIAEKTASWQRPESSFTKWKI